jgi:hypothetical protein
MEGGAAYDDVNAASEFPSQLQNMIEKVGYCDEQLYNCDETVVYFFFIFFFNLLFSVC